MTERTHADIIRLWPSVSEFGRAIGIAKPSTAHSMLERGIPPKHFPAVIAALERCGFPPATYAELSAVHKQLKEQRRVKKNEG